MENPTECYRLAFSTYVADHHWMFHKLQLVQKPTGYLKSILGGFGLPIFVHHAGGGSSVLLARVSWMLRWNLLWCMCSGLKSPSVGLLDLGWESMNMAGYSCKQRFTFTDSVGPVCMCSPSPFLGAVVSLVEIHPPVSCWHLFLALPLLYLYPLIVITACKYF